MWIGFEVRGPVAGEMGGVRGGTSVRGCFSYDLVRLVGWSEVAQDGKETDRT